MERNIEKRSLRINSSEEAANEPSEVVLYETEAASEKKPFQFNIKDRSIVVNGIKKYLAPTEYRLLRTLKDGQGRIISREDLRFQLAGPRKPQASPESLRFWMSRLDRKLQNPQGFKFINNLKGVGYRFNTTPSETERTEEVEYRLGGGRIYHPESNMIEVEGERNYLTDTENKLFWLLAENLNEVMSKEELIDEVWGIDSGIDTQNALKKSIQRLRRKTKDEKIEGEDQFFLIRTVHGKGYMLFVYPAQRNPQNTH